MKWIKRIIGGVLLLLLLPLLLAVLLSKTAGTPQSLALSNGLNLNIEHISFGDQHTYGPPEFPVGILKQIIPSLPVLPTIHHGTSSDNLVVWLSLENKKKNWILPMTNLVSVVARDQHGSRFVSGNILTVDDKRWRYRPRWGGNQTPPPGSNWFMSLISLEQYPRGEATFELDLVDQHDEIMATLTIRNPSIREEKKWTPDSFPITKKTDQVEIKLLSFTNAWRINRSGRVYKELPQFHANWDFSGIDGSGRYWQADSGVIEDSFGNISIIGGEMEGNASLHSRAWAVTFDFFQRPEAPVSPDQVWELSMDIPKKGTSKAMNLSKTLLGTLIELKSLTGPNTKASFVDGIPKTQETEENASGTNISSSSKFTGKDWIYTTTIRTEDLILGFRYPSENHKHRINILSRNGESNYKPMQMRYQSGSDYYFTMQQKASDGPLEVKIVIQPVFQETFFVAPRLDPPVHQFTRAKKIKDRDPETPEQVIDLSEFYTQGLNDRVNLIGSVGNTSIGLSFGLPRLVPGLSTLNGIQWDLRGTITLTGKALYYYYLKYPETVHGIPINRRAGKLHFLHGCLWMEKPGQQIGKYVVHYEDDHSETIPLAYEENIANILVHPKLTIPNIPSATLVEFDLPSRSQHNEGDSQPIYHFTWSNPHPEKKIRSMEFHSLRTMSAPILMGLSLEP